VGKKKKRNLISFVVRLGESEWRGIFWLDRCFPGNELEGNESSISRGWDTSILTLKTVKIWQGKYECSSLGFSNLW
jgi:hypothetical protein